MCVLIKINTTICFCNRHVFIKPLDVYKQAKTHNSVIITKNINFYYSMSTYEAMHSNTVTVIPSVCLFNCYSPVLHCWASHDECICV